MCVRRCQDFFTATFFKPLKKQEVYLVNVWAFYANILHDNSKRCTRCENEWKINSVSFYCFGSHSCSPWTDYMKKKLKTSMVSTVISYDKQFFSLSLLFCFVFFCVFFSSFACFSFFAYYEKISEIWICFLLFRWCARVLVMFSIFIYFFASLFCIAERAIQIY